MIAGERTRPLHATTRMVHCFAIGHLSGRPGAGDFVDHGMRAILERHRDASNGGYFWSFDDDGPRETDKLAYGHAFVLLAASSARIAGHPSADRLLADISEILDRRFWEPAHGASAEEFSADWSPISAYRGQNSNMHLTEALMAAFEATGDRLYLERAESIADLILRRMAGSNDWRVPEHYRADWTIDREYKGSDMFRPYGTTPGHWLEWARLALQLWALGGRRVEWLPGAARSLFAQAIGPGWDAARGGFYYTLDWSGRPLIRDRLWWPCCEGIGAATFLAAHHGDALYEDVVPAAVELCGAPFHRSPRRRLARAARRLARPGRALLRRQARHLPRLAGLPHPALSGRRQSDARDHTGGVSARPSRRIVTSLRTAPSTGSVRRTKG